MLVVLVERERNDGILRDCETARLRDEEGYGGLTIRVKRLDGARLAFISKSRSVALADPTWPWTQDWSFSGRGLRCTALFLPLCAPQQLLT